MTAEETFTISEPEFILEYTSELGAPRSNDFQNFLKDVQKAAEGIAPTDEIISVTAEEVESPIQNVFAITLRIRTSSWFSGGELLNVTITKILSTAQAVEYEATDTALQRFAKSQSDRLVSRLGSTTRTIAEAV